jgi:hypothetical protein
VRNDYTQKTPRNAGSSHRREDWALGVRENLPKKSTILALFPDILTKGELEF